MRAVFALACIMAFTALGAAQSVPTQVRQTSQKVAERTVVLTVRGMT